MMYLAYILSNDAILLSLAFSILIDCVVMFGMAGNRELPKNMERFTKPLSMFLVFLLLYKVIFWTI